MQFTAPLPRTGIRLTKNPLLALLTMSVAATPAFAAFLHTDAGTYDYLDTANWNASTIDNTWSSSLTGDQTLTFGTNHTLTSSLSISNTGTFNHTFIGSAADRTLTLGGNISLGSNSTNSNTNTVTLGSTTLNQALNIDLGSGTRTFFAGTNRTLEILNVISSGSGTFGVTKTGVGTLILANTANTYTGTTSIGASGQPGGVLVVTKLADGGQASSIGAGTNAANRLVFGGSTTGTLRYVGSGDSTDRRFTVGGAGAIIDASGTGALHFTNSGSPDVSPSGGNARTITLTGTNTDDNTMSTLFADSGAGKTSITKEGVGTWVLAGANTATGDITVTQGTLAIGAANRLADQANLVMNGGTFDTRGFSETLGTLTLSADSIIDLGFGASVLAFADSSDVIWGESFSLSFINVTDGVDSIRFGTTQDGLTLAQLSQITINGSIVTIDSSGFLAAIPEPSSYGLIAGISGLLVVGLRRRQSR